MNSQKFKKEPPSYSPEVMLAALKRWQMLYFNPRRKSVPSIQQLLRETAMASIETKRGLHITKSGSGNEAQAA